MSVTLRTRLTALVLCLFLLTGCGGSDDFVSVVIVETETEEKPGFVDRLEDWWYDIWYTFFAGDRTKAAIREAEESYEREHG